jgi:TRAP-type C4-dicarboxylate transport system permease large subunit
VLGTIYGGLATVTEAAGLGVVVAIIMGFTWGTLTIGKLWEAIISGSRIVAAIVFVILGTLILAQAVANQGLPRQVFEMVSSAGLSKYEVMFVLTLIYFLLGCFFDGLSLMIMTLSIVFPLMISLGFDPVWLGVIITLLIEIGAITPPVGVNLYVLLAISRDEVTLPEAARATIPYWSILILAIVILTAFPEIALYLTKFI